MEELFDGFDAVSQIGPIRLRRSCLSMHVDVLSPRIEDLRNEGSRINGNAITLPMQSRRNCSTKLNYEQRESPRL